MSVGGEEEMILGVFEGGDGEGTGTFRNLSEPTVRQQAACQL